jgi:hypothetical protein
MARFSRITIQEIPSREVAVIRFRGRASQEDVGETESRLLGALREKGITTVGEPFLMRYNAPFTRDSCAGTRWGLRSGERMGNHAGFTRPSQITTDIQPSPQIPSLTRIAFHIAPSISLTFPTSLPWL